MAENITKIKVGDDERCISLDTLVIDTAGLGFDADGKLGVRLGSSMFAEDSGIGVKISPDTQNYLQREHYGLSLKLDNMAGAMGKNLGLVIDAYKNLLKIGTDAEPLRLGTGLKGGDNGRTLCLSLGSGLEFDGVVDEQIAPRVVVKLLEGQSLQFTSGGELSINYEALARILVSNYGFVRNN